MTRLIEFIAVLVTLPIGLIALFLGAAYGAVCLGWRNGVKAWKY